MRAMTLGKVVIVLAVGGLLLCQAAVSAQPVPGVAQVRFAGPSGMKVWLQTPGGGFGRQPELTAPGRLNLRQGQTYRLKLTDIPGRPGLTLYPTLQLAAGPQGQGFLRHAAIPLEVTGEDFDEAAAGRLVTRSISMPGGNVVAVLRMGNIDLER